MTPEPTPAVRPLRRAGRPARPLPAGRPRGRATLRTAVAGAVLWWGASLVGVAEAQAQEGSPAVQDQPARAPLLAQSKRGKRKGRRRRPKAEDTDSSQTQTQESSQKNGEPDPETSKAGQQKGGGGTTAGNLRRSNRMEFDARLIRGETAGSGAVVLFDRGQRVLPQLTKARTRFLDDTLAEMYERPTDRALPEAEQAE